MHKIAFGATLWGHQGQYKALYVKLLTQRNFVAEFHQENVSFTRKNSEVAFLSHPVVGVAWG